MAIASSSIDYEFKKNDKSTSQSKLDFYESMYHFKKMFPKFDSEVIETILRSNNGSVDKTLDQLLTLSGEIEETTKPANNSLQRNSCNLISPLDEPLTNEIHDLPPSYNEIMSSSSISSSSDTSKEKNNDLIDFNNNSKIEETQIRSCLNSVQSDSNLDSDKFLKCKNNSSPDFIRNFNQMLIGDLSKDFLRIKLTKDQINTYKSSIKVAKRDEITALLNNKTPKNPELSFELKRQLDNLMNQLEEQETDLDDWEEKYKNLLKSFENKRLQIMQDEYLAKLLQNEEFLNEIRTDRDFIDSLNDESKSSNKHDEHDFDRNFKFQDYTTKTLSNAELQAKLSNMGKISKMKFNKLASKFMSKKKSKSSRDIEFNSINFNSLDGYSSTGSSLKDNDFEIDENSSYDLEKIKAEELNSATNTLSKSNRYKKAYNSIKTAIKRNNNSSIPSQLPDFRDPYSENNNYKASMDKNNFY